jgi:hypothetical protein
VGRLLSSAWVHSASSAVNQRPQLHWQPRLDSLGGCSDVNLHLKEHGCTAALAASVSGMLSANQRFPVAKLITLCLCHKFLWGSTRIRKHHSCLLTLVISNYGLARGSASHANAHSAVLTLPQGNSQNMFTSSNSNVVVPMRGSGGSSSHNSWDQVTSTGAGNFVNPRKGDVETWILQEYCNAGTLLDAVLAGTSRGFFVGEVPQMVSGVRHMVGALDAKHCLINRHEICGKCCCSGN